jgi:regulator of sigma E protease
VNYNREEPPKDAAGNPSPGSGIAEEKPIAVKGFRADVIVPHGTEVVAAEFITPEPGYRVGLVLDHEDKVQKLVLNNKDKYPNALVMEVEHADIEHELVIKGYLDGDESEKLRTFHIFPNAVLVEDGIESLIAPYDRQFASKTVGQRAMAIFAGPMMNFILAFVIFLVIGLLQGIPSDDPRLGKLTDDGAAIGAARACGGAASASPGVRRLVSRNLDA